MFTPLLPAYFYFNHTATPEIYTLPYTTLFRSRLQSEPCDQAREPVRGFFQALQRSCKREAEVSGSTWTESRSIEQRDRLLDRKSTRLNSSHVAISYAVFCLKKKKIRCYDCCRK